MRLALLLVACASPTLAQAPTSAPTFAGTWHAATGTFEPAVLGSGTPVAECGLGLVFNNSAPSGFYLPDAALENTVVDEGVVPNVAIGGPAELYLIRAFTIGYATDSAAPAGIDIDVSFWENGATCSTVAALGSPDATFALTGLPGSINGTVQPYLVRVDLSGGFEFALDATNGNIQFNYALRFPGQVGTATGPLIAGDPVGCPPGSGTFGDNLGCNGLGAGTGLGAEDRFHVEADGSAPAGCTNFGGAPFASFYLTLDSGVQNDVCSNPDVLGSALGTFPYDTTCATTSGQTSCATMRDDLFFRWTAPADGDYVFDTCGTSYDTKLAVFDGGGCGTPCLDANDDACGTASRVVIPGALAGDTFVVQVGGFGSTDNGPGVLNIGVEPCSVAVDDALEDNDDCASATPLTSGLYPDLLATRTDPDWYTVTLQPDELLTVDVLFEHDLGDLDLFLYDACGGQAIAQSAGASDVEFVQWRNTTGAPLTLHVQVLLFFFSLPDCNTYTLQLDVGDDLGTNYCFANANSSGASARMSASGSTSLAANDLVLECYDMPTVAPNNIWNYFAVGTQPGWVPLASGMGNLCIGGSLGRFLGPGQLTNAGLTGSTAVAIDVGVMPDGVPLPLAGDTYYFTNFYRDVVSGSVTSNLADGLAVTFTP